MSSKGHAAAVKFMKSFGIPMLVTGGGGYTKANVARCWTYETAVLVDEEINDAIPMNKFYEYYVPDHKIQVQASKDIINQNTRSVSLM